MINTMKLPAVNFASVLYLSAWTVVLAQDPAELNLGTYPGLNISGPVGVVYSIEYTEDPAQPSTAGWHCLEFLQLPASPYLWIDKSAPATAQRFYRANELSGLTNMVFITPGTFRMGSPDDEQGRWENEGPQTAVIISRGVWMGRHEVTQGEYLSVMATNPSYFNGVRGTNDYGNDLNRPVENVLWEEAVAYCSRLTEIDQAAGRIPMGSAYRLPTEAEWEYACRAWTSTRFNFGEDPGETELSDYAWYLSNSSIRTQPVGLKLPNHWGLYDMHGNVNEWCLDTTAGTGTQGLPGGILLDPLESGEGNRHMLRGGSYWNIADHCRSANRGWQIDTRYEWNGFRIALAPTQP